MMDKKGKYVYITEKQIGAIAKVMYYAENIYFDPDDPNVEDESTGEVYFELKKIFEKYYSPKPSRVK